ncbi:MAG: hypothetical protein Q8O64_12815 [Sideroxyarcus sp.]|nr:hypothetical protein [Sideroxyarcus sp.]
MNAVNAKKIKRRAIVAEQEAHLARVCASLEDVKSGKIKKFKTAADLLKALETKSNRVDVACAVRTT